MSMNMGSGDSSRAISAMVTPEQESRGLLLPEMKDIRRVSAAVALAVGKEARDAGLGRLLDDARLEAIIAKAQYEPRYMPCRAGTYGSA